MLFDDNVVLHDQRLHIPSYLTSAHTEALNYSIALFMHIV